MKTAFGVTKLSCLKAAAESGDWPGALAIAAKFPNLGAEKTAIMRAWEAVARPDFQRQLGRDPQALIDTGICALKSKYRL